MKKEYSLLYEESKISAEVIMIGNRYFSNYNKKSKRFLFGWSLASAKMFTYCRNEDKFNIIAMLQKKGYKPTVRAIYLSIM